MTNCLAKDYRFTLAAEPHYICSCSMSLHVGAAHRNILLLINIITKNQKRVCPKIM
jgi:hypothetical protein